MSYPLPTLPNLGYFERQAKHLVDAQCHGNSQAAREIKEYLPRAAHVSAQDIFNTDFTLQEAQYVVANQYGFNSWDQMVLLVNEVNRPEGGITVYRIDSKTARRITWRRSQCI